MDGSVARAPRGEDDGVLLRASPPRRSLQPCAPRGEEARKTPTMPTRHAQHFDHHAAISHSAARAGARGVVVQGGDQDLHDLWNAEM